MMEILSIENDERKKRLLLLEELEQHGIILKGDEASKAPESTLERLLQEVKSRQDSSTTQDLFMDFYESMVRDYIVKLTIASVSFFSCYPWAALFWRLITITTRDQTHKYAHIVQKYNFWQFKTIHGFIQESY